MCGIVGIYNINKNPVDSSRLKRMTNLLERRGPDGWGFYFNNNIGFGHRRLSIIDLSSAGHQPMSNEDGTVWIIFNGEIYNYLEIRSDLLKRGHQFKSHTDTEIIIHAYEEWGESCLTKFNGMWAFAIWDERKNSLFLARDRLGVKPLYYYLDDKIFIFASEIKAILDYGVARIPNQELIYDFLKFGVLDYTQESFFRNIKKLPAAHFAFLNQEGRLHLTQYWDFNVSSEIECQNKKNEEEDVQEFLDIFTDAVRLRLRSDVPVGSCLSGGLDSSSVVILMNQLLKKEGIKEISKYQNSFSSCFEDRRFDERKYIKEVFQNAGIKGNFIFPQPEEFISELDEFLWHQEEPFRGTSMYAQYKVYQRAKKMKVKVLLDGQGSDEQLAGYRKFYFFYLRYLLEQRYYVKFLQEFIYLFLSLSVLRTLNVLSGLRYFSVGAKFQNTNKFLQQDFSKKFLDRYIPFSYNSQIGQRFKEDITMWSLPVLLRYCDKSSSACSVEVRLPFLDYRLVEKIASIPLEQKMRSGWTKFILRKAMIGIIPETIRLRKSKLGFVTPEKVWFKTVLHGELRQLFDKAEFIKEYANLNELKKEFQKYLHGRSLLSHDIFFRFFIVERWAKKFFLKR